MGKLIKSLAEIFNNPEKYVVEQETGAIDIVKNKTERVILQKYRKRELSARSF